MKNFRRNLRRQPVVTSSTPAAESQVLKPSEPAPILVDIREDDMATVDNPLTVTVENLETSILLFSLQTNCPASYSVAPRPYGVLREKCAAKIQVTVRQVEVVVEEKHKRHSSSRSLGNLLQYRMHEPPPPDTDAYGRVELLDVPRVTERRLSGEMSFCSPSMMMLPSSRNIDSAATGGGLSSSGAIDTTTPKQNPSAKIHMLRVEVRPLPETFPVDQIASLEADRDRFRTLWQSLSPGYHTVQPLRSLNPSLALPPPVAAAASLHSLSHRRLQEVVQSSTPPMLPRRPSKVEDDEQSLLPVVSQETLDDPHMPPLSFGSRHASVIEQQRSVSPPQRKEEDGEDTHATSRRFLEETETAADDEPLEMHDSLVAPPMGPSFGSLVYLGKEEGGESGPPVDVMAVAVQREVEVPPNATPPVALQAPPPPQPHKSARLDEEEEILKDIESLQQEAAALLLSVQSWSSELEFLREYRALSRAMQIIESESAVLNDEIRSLELEDAVRELAEGEETSRVAILRDEDCTRSELHTDIIQIAQSAFVVPPSPPPPLLDIAPRIAAEGDNSWTTIPIPQVVGIAAIFAAFCNNFLY